MYSYLRMKSIGRPSNIFYYPYNIAGSIVLHDWNNNEYSSMTRNVLQLLIK